MPDRIALYHQRKAESDAPLGSPETPPTGAPNPANVERMLRAALTEGQSRSLTLRQQRAGVVERMGAIVQTAERFNRDLSGGERDRYDALNQEFRDFTEAITQAEAEEWREKQGATPIGSSLGDAVRIPSQRGRGGVPVLRSTDKLADYVRSQGHSAAGQLSFGKMIRGQLLGDWRGADLERRALLESNAGSGGVLVPAPLAAQVLDLARAKTRVFQAGAQTVPMDSAKLTIGRQASDPSVGWFSEAQVMAESDLTFDTVELKAKTLRCLVKFSIEMLGDVDNIDTIASNAVSQAMALKLDAAALRGSGVDPEPKGLRNQTGVTIVDVGANGAAPTWDMFIDGIEAVRGSNFEPNASIHAVRTEVDLARLKDSTGQYLRPPAILDGLSRLDSTSIPIDLDHGTATNASEAYVGQWDQLLVGMRTDFQIQPINELYADTAERAIFCYLRADFVPARAEAFAILDGIVPA